MTSSSAGNKARGSISNSQRPTIGFKIPRLRFEVRLIGLLLLLAVPAVFLGCAALYRWHVSPPIWICVLVVLIFILAVLVRTIFRHVVRPLQTLSNVVAALRE